MEEEEDMEPARDTVLIVDDEEGVGELMRALLEGEPYEVIVARSGAECLLAVARHRPRLVLLDLSMPDMDGLETLRKLHEQGDEPPVIVVTGHGGIESARQAMELGAYEYVTKPVNPLFLKAAVREGLSLRAEHREVRA